MKVYTSYGFRGLNNFYKKHGHEPVEHLHLADLLVIEGGVDIDWRLYATKAHPYTQGPSIKRDLTEMGDIHLAMEYGIPVAGICRGAQLCNVIAGGTLIQHVDNHIGDHSIYAPSGEYIGVMTSVHHQQMLPNSQKNYELLAIAKGQATTRELADIELGVFELQEDIPEVEILWYPEEKFLCYQGHPSWGDEAEEYRFWEMLTQRMG